MQPEQTVTPGASEQLPVSPAGSSERIPVMPTPEGGIETGAERKEQTSEAQAAAADAAATGAPVAPTIITPVANDTTISDSPVVAGDDDVIEKEWVDKAKKIVKDTQNDPHTRTSQVNQLQKDYLKKRYGKELGAAQ